MMVIFGGHTKGRWCGVLGGIKQKRSNQYKK